MKYSDSAYWAEINVSTKDNRRKQDFEFYIEDPIL